MKSQYEASSSRSVLKSVTSPKSFHDNNFSIESNFLNNYYENGMKKALAFDRQKSFSQALTGYL